MLGLRSRRAAVLAVLTAAATILPVSEASSIPVAADTVATARSTPAATKVVGVSPLDAHGHIRPRYTVFRTARGYCWTSSFMNGRAYRCMMGNYIMDPCWKEAGRNSVACLILPWSTGVTRLRLTRGVPAPEPSVPGIWGLRLGGGVGVNCLVFTGAGGFIGKHHISYYCSKGWVLLDDLNRQGAVWTIATARQVDDHYQQRGRKPLAQAWKAVVL